MFKKLPEVKQESTRFAWKKVNAGSWMELAENCFAHFALDIEKPCVVLNVATGSSTRLDHPRAEQGIVLNDRESATISSDSIKIWDKKNFTQKKEIPLFPKSRDLAEAGVVRRVCLMSERNKLLGLTTNFGLTKAALWTLDLSTGAISYFFADLKTFIPTDIIKIPGQLNKLLMISNKGVYLAEMENGKLKNASKFYFDYVVDENIKSISISPSGKYWASKGLTTLEVWELAENKNFSKIARFTGANNPLWQGDKLVYLNHTQVWYFDPENLCSASITKPNGDWNTLISTQSGGFVQMHQCFVNKQEVLEMDLSRSVPAWQKEMKNHFPAKILNVINSYATPSFFPSVKTPFPACLSRPMQVQIHYVLNEVESKLLISDPESSPNVLLILQVQLIQDALKIIGKLKDFSETHLKKTIVDLLDSSRYAPLKTDQKIHNKIELLFLNIYHDLRLETDLHLRQY